MVSPEVVSYLQENLPKFPIEELRRQLFAEGVSDLDFQDCLAAALRAPRTEKKKLALPAGNRSAQLFLILGVLVFVGVALFALSQKSAPAEDPNAATAGGESGFVGPSQWVVRLPQGYVGATGFKDSGKKHEVVHFCPKGTDPTNFLNEGLYGQLGIVRLEVFPSPFPDNPTGVSTMAQRVQSRLTGQGEKFSLKNVQVGTLPGIQVNVLAPFPRVEAYVLGKSSLYYFYAGQEDTVWRDILLSLRDAHSEQ
jgi:hypothetical protein